MFFANLSYIFILREGQPTHCSWQTLTQLLVLLVGAGAAQLFAVEKVPLVGVFVALAAEKRDAHRRLLNCQSVVTPMRFATKIA